MKDLLEMDSKFDAFEETGSLLICQVITMHFVEITLFLYRMITFSSASNPILLTSACWTCMNVLFVLYSIALIIHLQEKVKKTGQSLSDLFFTHKLSASEYVFVLILVDKIKLVASRSITVWNIVKINRKLVLAIYSSFLTIAVLLVQMDNGALKSNAALKNVTLV